MMVEDAARLQRQNQENHARLLTAASADERLAIVQKLLLTDLELSGVIQQLLALHEQAARDAHGGGDNG